MDQLQELQNQENKIPNQQSKTSQAGTSEPNSIKRSSRFDVFASIFDVFEFEEYEE